jgi:putative membrane protein
MILIGTGIGFWVVTLVPAETSESPLFVFLSGSVAICAMILPGISGSYILLILRKYDFILSQIGKLGSGETVNAMITLFPFILGAVVGLALFSRMLSWLLDRYEAKTLGVLIGFLIGSLYVIWPYQERAYEEIITQENIVAYSSPQAVELRKNPPNENRPEFKRLGEVITIKEDKKVEIQTINKKLIKSNPFIPYATIEQAGTKHFGDGVWGIIIGLLMVVGLDYLRAKK